MYCVLQILIESVDEVDNEANQDICGNESDDDAEPGITAVECRERQEDATKHNEQLDDDFDAFP